ncbi:MAG: nuclear transport factor 2 family protein [Gammaproteobacteria bacterium]
MKNLLLVILLITPGLASADFHFQNRADVLDAKEQKLAAEITAFLADYEIAYNNQDYRTVKSMWVDDGNPIYIAEEVPFPLYGQDRLNNYFNPRPGKRILDGIDNKYSEVRAKYITEDVAVATYKLDYDIKLVGMPAQHGWNRIMATFVKDNGDWKLSAYAEAPQGPATMVRKMIKATPAESEEQKAAYKTTRDTITALSRAGVGEGFDAFLEERKDLEPTH